MSITRDIVIIGGGHNGLVAAFYLARAGFKPLVLERRPAVGGSAITDEVHPGFRCSTLAHSIGPLSAKIAQDMRLASHGLEMLQPEVRVFAPTPDGRPLLLFDDAAKSAREIAKFSTRDAEKFPEFQRVLARLAGIIAFVAAQTPPSIEKPSSVDLWNMLKAAKEFRRLGKKEMFRLLRWGPMPVADLVAEWFESDLLRAVVASRGVFGAFLGPRSAGSSAVLLLRAAADPHPAGASGFPKGGLGALTKAMAAAATQAGAEVRTGTEVSRLSVKNGSVTGVVLAGGEEIAANTVVSGADPRRTFLRLIDPVHLEPGFLVRMQNYRCRGTVAKVNLALSRLPSFTALGNASGGAGLPAGTLDPASALSGRILIAPEIDYLEHAYDDAKYGRYSQQPFLDITIPSLADPSLAPRGQHVMSIYAQYAPFKLKAGNWNEQRQALGEVVVRTLADYAPEVTGLILHRQVITPQDLEEVYGLSGGHIFHGELSLDQLFTMRPLLGWARYRSPIKGLYLCGSGTHPGAGLTGHSGANAAREVLKDLRKSKGA